MSATILDFIAEQKMPVQEVTLDTGVDILRQGERCGLLYIMVSGQVEVVKNGSQLCTVNEPGAVFGELSILLGCYQNASVRTLTPCTFKVVTEAEKFLSANPKAAYLLACMLARRLSLLDSHFAELRNHVTAMQAEVAGLISK
jgi:CRP-like cAMP-binding protein